MSEKNEGMRLPPTKTVPIDRSELRKARISRGLSQGALARQAGISRSYLTEIEAGDKTPRMAVVRSLAGALGIELNSITEHST